MNIKMRIIAIVGVLLIGGLFFCTIMKKANRNIERAQAAINATLEDFTEQEYEVVEVWQRTLGRKNMPSFNQTYIFLKVKGESFNFNFGSDYSDIGKESKISDQLAQYIYPGAKVKILANRDDIAYASDRSLIRIIENFLSGSNQEVEIYKLTADNLVIVDQDIHTSPFSDRGFADIAVSENLVFLLFFCAAIYGISYRIIAMRRKKKMNKQSAIPDC